MAEHNLGAFIPPAAESRSDYYGDIDPMDGRYRDPEAEKYLGGETRIALQAYVEAALAHTLADFDICSREVAMEIEAACANVSAKEVDDREYGRGEFDGRGTRHDIKALTEAISAQISDEAKPWVHATATSYDIVSTANALQYREAMNGLVMPRLVKLGDNLADLAERYADTPQIGRTHGQHAVPITFGFGVSRYLGRLGESATELDRHTFGLQGKFSGAVGGYNASSLIMDNPIVFEAALLAKLGLEPCEHATQIVPAENTTRLLAELGITAGIMAQIANDMRNLQRTEIGEVGEPFDREHATGSSAMPQKRNPITFEQVAGFERVVIPQVLTSYLNLTSEHQRDLRDSSAGRFHGIMLAEVAHMAKTLNRILPKLEVDTVNLDRNLGAQKGAIGSEPLQVYLRQYGHPAAHNAAKRIVQKALDEDQNLGEAVIDDEEIASTYWPLMTEAEQEIVLHPEHAYLGLTVEQTHNEVAKWRELRQQLAGYGRAA